MAFNQNELWNTKAIGFVTRARQELWGKHNAGIMAFLFERGLSNKTAEKLLLGWNRRGKLRSAESWGLDPGKVTSEEGKIFFPEGIVVPYVLEEQLRKITIVVCDEDSSAAKQLIVEGSQPISMVYGKTGSDVNTVVVDNILDGFFVLQELGENTCLVIPHDLSEVPDDFTAGQLVNSGSITFLTHREGKSCEKWSEKFAHSTIKTYGTRGELETIIR